MAEEIDGLLTCRDLRCAGCAEARSPAGPFFDRPVLFLIARAAFLAVQIVPRGAKRAQEAPRRAQERFWSHVGSILDPPGKQKP